MDGASVPGGLLGFTLLRDPVGAMEDAIRTLPSFRKYRERTKVMRAPEEYPLQIVQLERPSAQPVARELLVQVMASSGRERLISCHMHRADRPGA